MLRQQRVALKVSRRAAGLRVMLSTNAVPDKDSHLDTPVPIKVMPSGEVSRPSSDRTWDAFHGITFASSHGNTPSQTVPHVAHSRPAQATSAQIDPCLWTEPQTRQLTGSRGENPEGSGNVIPSNKRGHMLEGQCRNGTMTPNSNDDAPSSRIGHPENCLASDIKAFRTPLGFHIPESKLRDAMLAEPTSTASYWHFTLYQGPGGDRDKVKVHYCKNKETTERIAQLFLDKEVIGFDIEWHPSASAADGITKNVSLIQIASEERVLLAHIARYPDAAISEQEQRVEDFVAPSLKKIMESPSITKVGVAIKADCTRLRKFLNIDSHGLFELSHLHKLVKFYSGNVSKINKLLVSLSQQVQEHLQLPLFKGAVRMSDWGSTQDLTYEQTRYAASDSYAAFQLYYILEAKRAALEPTPPRPAHVEQNLPIRLAEGQIVAATDEALEPIEEAITGTPSSTRTSLEDDFQTMAIEDRASLYPELPPSPESSSSSSSSSSSPPSSTLSPPPRPPPSPKSPSNILSNEHLAPEILEANASVTNYIESRPTTMKLKPNRAHLRAHHLWQHRSMEPAAIAALLRVDVSTVAVYVLQAIRSENCPFDEKRTRSLVPLAPRVLRDHFERLISNRLRKRVEVAGDGKRE